jgi:hypothetical protein
LPLANELLPSETAGAATTSKTVSASVAISSRATVWFPQRAFFGFGGAKLGTPVSSALIVILANQWRSH